MKLWLFNFHLNDYFQKFNLKSIVESTYQNNIMNKSLQKNENLSFEYLHKWGNDEIQQYS